MRKVLTCPARQNVCCSRPLALAAAAVRRPSPPRGRPAASSAIIVTDPANPYWLTEGKVAKATAEKLGYTANVGASKGDTNTESKLIDTAITNKSVAIILDPADADGSIGAVKKAVAAGIPVFLVNAEINQEGLAKAQLVSNNAQGAALGAQQWVEGRRRQGQLCRAVRQPRRQQRRDALERLRDGAEPVPGSEEGRQRKSPNWDRTQGYPEDAVLSAGSPRHHRRDLRQ